MPSNLVLISRTRSAKGASRSPAITSASGSRSRPISRSPGSSVRKRSACPPAPSVASTSTAPEPSRLRRVSAGRSSSTQRLSRTGMCPWSGLVSMASPPRKGSDAPWSLSEQMDLASGKYARAGSDRGRGTRSSKPQSDDVAQSFIARRGEVLFVGLLVVPPRLGVPDLQVVDRADHHAVLGQVGVATVVDRQRDAALRIGVLLVGGGGEVAQERAGFRVAP